MTKAELLKEVKRLEQELSEAKLEILILKRRMVTARDFPPCPNPNNPPIWISNPDPYADKRMTNRRNGYMECAINGH